MMMKHACPRGLFDELLSNVMEYSLMLTLLRGRVAFISQLGTCLTYFPFSFVMSSDDNEEDDDEDDEDDDDSEDESTTNVVMVRYQISLKSL